MPRGHFVRQMFGSLSSISEITIFFSRYFIKLRLQGFLQLTSHIRFVPFSDATAIFSSFSTRGRFD